LRDAVNPVRPRIVDRDCAPVVDHQSTRLSKKTAYRRSF
jgi:hypothetical protein